MLKKDVILTGENLTDAQAGFDSQNASEPAVHLTLDGKGARIFRDVTRENIGNRMAIVLVEKGQGEVITAPVIRGEIPGGRVQISGRRTSIEAAETALLLRAPGPRAACGRAAEDPAMASAALRALPAALFGFHGGPMSCW